MILARIVCFDIKYLCVLFSLHNFLFSLFRYFLFMQSGMTYPKIAMKFKRRDFQ